MSLRMKLVLLFVAITLIAVVLVATKNKVPENTIKAGFGSEFLTRPDGYPGLIKAYGFEFTSDPVHLDPGLMYRAVADGAVDVICGFATDGRIPAYDLKVLKDDKGFFPPYYAAPLVRSETLKNYPEIEDILNKLSGKLSDDTIQKLNYEVDEKGRKPSKVAREWLIEQGLINTDSKSGEAKEGRVTIGSKSFTEQELIGHMMAILIEENTNIEVVRKLNLGGTMICFNALKAGDLDLYAEYTGTGLMAILKMDIINDPDKVYNLVKHAFKNDFDVVWLQPFGFNNTYTLTMRKDQARNLGINSISDLANQVNKEKK